MVEKIESITIKNSYHACDVCGKRIVLKCSLFFCRICGAELCRDCTTLISDEDGEHQYPAYCSKCFAVGERYLVEERAEDERFRAAIKDIIARWKQDTKDAEDGVGHA